MKKLLLTVVFCAVFAGVVWADDIVHIELMEELDDAVIFGKEDYMAKVAEIREYVSSYDSNYQFGIADITDCFDQEYEPHPEFPRLKRVKSCSCVEVSIPGNTIGAELAWEVLSDREEFASLMTEHRGSEGKNPQHLNVLIDFPRNKCRWFGSRKYLPNYQLGIWKRYHKIYVVIDSDTGYDEIKPKIVQAIIGYDDLPEMPEPYKL
ncbi:hypothetical protein ACFL2B_03365 [Patescibacteria group bacterium]